MTPRARGRLATLLLLSGLTACAAGKTEGPLASTSGDGGGTICVPVGDKAHASIAEEAVRNTSTAELTVTDVRVAGSEGKVVDWFLADNDWPDAGVRKRDLPDPSDARLSNTVGAHEIALVAFTVEAKDLGAPWQTRVWVSYTGPHGPRRLGLKFRVRFMPRGQDCDMSSDG